MNSRERVQATLESRVFTVEEFQEPHKAPMLDEYHRLRDY